MSAARKKNSEPQRQAVLYVRISDDPEGLEKGLDRQETDCRAFADAHNMTVVEVFRENDTSALKQRTITLPSGEKVRRVVRPRFRAMLQRLSKGGGDAIVTYDLDLLLTTVFVTPDDLLPESTKNVMRRVTEAEVVTLAVAQAIMGIPSDRRFLAVAGKRLKHLFPVIPQQSGYLKRRRRLTESLAWLMGTFATQSPGFYDDLLLVDSTPVECARSRETVKRSALADAADYGYCASHSRYFWGFRSHALFSPDGTPRAIELRSPKLDEREVAISMLERLRRDGPLTMIGDKGYTGREFKTQLEALNVTIIRPRRKDETGQGPHLAPIRQWIESIFWTCKDLLTLERHGARTLPGLRTRILARFCCLAACVTLNHQLGRKSRALVDYCA